MLFSFYYLLWATEGDEVVSFIDLIRRPHFGLGDLADTSPPAQLRRFRALCTVEMLRVTWEKTNNPYVRIIDPPLTPSEGGYCF